MAGPGLERYRLALLAAREDVGNPRVATDWAVFGYEKHHDLKLLDSGAGGPDELAGKFSASSVMYGLCRVPDPGSGTPRIVLISWVGEKVPESHRAERAGHLPAIRSFFREATALVSARRPEDVTLEGLRRALAQLEPPAPRAPRRGTLPDIPELVGTNYRKTNPALEIQRTQRHSFWEQAEREEQQRKEEERRREREQRRRWERERLEEERRGAAERERWLQERERLIEERRQEQARLDAEERKKEQERWEQQQREHEEAERERRASRGGSGTAAEAAILVSQRTQNPREFFRQRERSGSTSGPALPGGPPGARRPFLRYQRSLTESAFIFRRPEPPSTPPPGISRGAPPLSPGRPPPPLPPGPAGTGTPQCATLGTPTSPARAGSLHATSPLGTGTPQCATTGTPISPVGSGTPPSATLETPPSPARAGSPHAISPVGTGTPQCAITGTPPSPAGTGTPPSVTPRSPPSSVVMETPKCATTGTPPSPMGTGTPHSITLGTPHSVTTRPRSPPVMSGPPFSPPRMEVPPGSPGSGYPDSTYGVEPLPLPSTPGLGSPPRPSQDEEGSPPDIPPLPSPPGTPRDEKGPPMDTPPLPSPPGTPRDEKGPPMDTPPLPSPPGTPLDEEGPPPDTPPLPSPPAWGSLGPLDEGVPSPQGVSPTPPDRPPPPRPSPPRLVEDPQDSGSNGIGGRQWGGWEAPWEPGPPPGQGDEPSESLVLHKATPGFALLLARDTPHPPLLGGPSPPTEDEDLSPHAV